MTKTVGCGVRFMVQYAPTFGELICERERWHEDAHESGGFVWGPRDQSKDIFVARMREAERVRRERKQVWYRRKRRAV